jgi:hypothetical protein
LSVRRSVCFENPDPAALDNAQCDRCKAEFRAALNMATAIELNVQAKFDALGDIPAGVALSLVLRDIAVFKTKTVKEVADMLERRDDDQ